MPNDDIVLTELGWVSVSNVKVIVCGLMSDVDVLNWLNVSIDVFDTDIKGFECTCVPDINTSILLKMT